MRHHAYNNFQKDVNEIMSMLLDSILVITCAYYLVFHCVLSLFLFYFNSFWAYCNNTVVRGPEKPISMMTDKI